MDQPPGELARFRPLLEEAQRATGDERSRLARAVLTALSAMAEPGRDEEECEAIVDALEAGLLSNLCDAAGRSCRAAAVEVLLAMGHPHALLVPPEDLDFAFRESVRGVTPQCPRCHWRSDGGAHWACTCKHIWNTFETYGVCPVCGHRWADTRCPSCSRWSKHLAFWEAGKSGPTG